MDTDRSTNMKTVIVSGASGFIGQHLIPLLLEHNLDVIALSRNENKARNFYWFNSVKFIPYDFHKLHELSKFKKDSSLIHLAWQGLPNYNSQIHIQHNLPASYKFIKYFLSLGIKNVLVTGTCLEYGLQSGPISSSAKPSPICSYAIAKAQLRQDLLQLKNETDFILQWARLFYTFGDGQNANSILSQLNKAIKDNSEYFNMSKGDQIRDYLPVTDLAHQILDLFLSRRDGVFNVCSGQPISIRELVERKIKECGSSIGLNLGYFPYNDFEPMSFWGIKDVFQTIYLPAVPNSPSNSQSNEVTLAPICLRYNKKLHLLENEAFDPMIVDYSENYENNQSYSKRFNNHMKEVLLILKSHMKKNSVIVEVGCGKGNFVELIQRDGYFHIQGYDAAYDGINPSIKKYYLKETDRIYADLVVLRHVLEHIKFPFKFLNMLKSIFGTSNIFIEVPNYDWIIKKGCFFDITYEHVNYFTEDSLKCLFTENSSTYGILFDEQYHYIFSDLASLNENFNDAFESDSWVYTSYEALFPNMNREIERISLLAEGRSAFIWGAGTKGCLFLSHCSVKGKLIGNLKFAVDINPKKIGKFLPGSQILIKSKEDFFKTVSNGDLLIISNPNYKIEIEEEIRSLGLNDLIIEVL